jgi:copper(I)-binding protein
MNVRALVSGLLLLSASSVAVAAAPACTPEVLKGWIRAAPPGATMLAGYAELRNGCPRPFVVTGVKGRDFVMAMVHETRVENGVSTMRLAKSSTLPAHGVLRFEPGGRHLMLMHPRRALPAGSVVKLELLLDDGSRVPGEFTVRKEPPASP